MTVYVDDMKPCLPNRKWRYNESCHMFADSEEELHKLAKSIGLKREWFQNVSRFPHYDLIRKKRALAVSNGAQEVDTHFVFNFVREREKK